jgi:hypothetical protein
MGRFRGEMRVIGRFVAGFSLFRSNCVNFSRKKREKNTPSLRAAAAFCAKFSLIVVVRLG